ncbi:hypothetical protein [Nostoc flagelliforme]|uniref:hypothetical protein n=1 Tax=Nostoc flagelliforme TaxID=1306274 RepID=UPI0012FD0736
METLWNLPEKVELMIRIAKVTMDKLCYCQGLKTQQIICSVISLLTAIALKGTATII